MPFKEVIDLEKVSISSNAFKDGGNIPARHTCDGRDLSPDLNWTGVPEKTKSLALVMDDPDAPMGTWVHWVLYNIPKDKKGLIEGVPRSEVLEDGSMHGRTDSRKTGYGGPCPPRGPAHRYYFKLYALDKSLNLPPNASKQEVEAAMEGHVLGKGELMGRYGR